MIFGSVCSGIEAASVAWGPLGFRAAWFAEIDPFPSAVLAHHYPEVRNLGDFPGIRNRWLRRIGSLAIDILVGGTPCQSFSVAGLRKGLDDARGNLALEFLRLAGRARPAWVVWENVPGVLSSNGGRDFGAFLAGLEELGYGWAYRTLDAQYVRVDGFGRAVPQRRRRVFVVGHLGDRGPAAAVLFERSCLSGNPPPSRQAGTRVAGTLDARVDGGGFPGTDGACGGHVIACQCHGTNVGPMGTLRSGNGNETGGVPFVALAFGWNKSPSQAMQVSETYDALQTSPTSNPAVLAPAIAFQERGRDGGRNLEWQEGLAYSLNAPSGGGRRHELNVCWRWAVRRLTPRECERLQGFPDDYTLVQYRGKPAADGPRYKALGNSMAVPVMRWIGQRLLAVHQL